MKAGWLTAGLLFAASTAMAADSASTSSAQWRLLSPSATVYPESPAPITEATLGTALRSGMPLPFDTAVTFSAGKFAFSGAERGARIRLRIAGPATLAPVEANRVRVDARRIEASVAGNTAWSLSLPGLTVHVLDADVLIDRADENRAVVSVVAGDHAFLRAGGKDYRLGAGDALTWISGPGGVTVETRRAPQSPVPLYPAANASLRAFRFLWRAVPEARGYRLEVATDPDFHDLRFSGDVGDITYFEPVRSVPLGVLYWRVRAVDRHGVPGPASTPAVVTVDRWAFP